jgi:hypothetical protein
MEVEEELCWEKENLDHVGFKGGHNAEVACPCEGFVIP